MATYTGLSAEQWSGRIQDFVIEKTVSGQTATVEQAADKIVHKPYVDNAVAVETTDGSYTASEMGSTDESYTIDTQLVSSERIFVKGAMQSHYPLTATSAENHGNAIARKKDQMFFATLASTLGNSVADGDLASATNSGGTNAIIASDSNVEEILDLGLQKAFEDNMDPNADVVAVLPFALARKSAEFLRGTGNSVADMALRSAFGYFGESQLGLSVYTSNLIEHEVVLSMATQPTADDTVVVNGVTFTFKASPSAAGEVDLGADVDATRANLAAAINGGSGAGSDYIALSTANRRAFNLKAITATNDDTANTLTIKCYGTLTVSETLTDGTDAFGDTYINVPMFQRGVIYDYTVVGQGADVLTVGDYSIVNGVAYTSKPVSGYTAFDREVTTTTGHKIWNNYTNFGSILKIKA